MLIPNNFEEYLEDIYGVNWKTPIKNITGLNTALQQLNFKHVFVKDKFKMILFLLNFKYYISLIFNPILIESISKPEFLILQVSLII